MRSSHFYESESHLSFFHSKLFVIVKVLIKCVEYLYLLLLFSTQAFELACGDYLFEPHSGENYSRDEGKSSRLDNLGPGMILEFSSV